MNRSLTSSINFFIVYIAVGFFVSLSVAEAQTISGKVVDKKGEPIQYVNVVLRQLTDSAYVGGSVTDSKGDYMIAVSNNEVNKNCFITFSCIGYDDIVINPTLQSSINVELKEKNTELSEVVVLSKRKAIEMQPDGQKINIKRLGLSNIGSVFNLLGMLPGVSVNGENINIVGRTGSPLVYVNGRELSDVSLLSRYDSKDIESVKIITNPGVKYSSSISSVIEIKVRNPEDGLGGSFMLEGSVGKKIGTRQYASLIYKKDAVDLFLMLNNSISKNKPSNGIDMSLPDLEKRELNINVDQDVSKTYRYVVSGINYTINKNNNIGIQYDFTQTPNWNINSIINTSIKHSGTTTNEKQISNYINKDSFHNINGYYLGQISPIYTLRYDMNYFTKQEHATNNFTVDKNGQTGNYQTDLTQNSWLVSGRLQNFIIVGNGQLTIGADGSYTNNKQKNMATLSSLNQTDSKIENQLIGAFVSYARAFGKIQAEIGTRYEYNNYNYYERGKIVSDQSKQYHYFAPSLQVMYQGAVSVGLSFKSSINRPSYSMLSDRHQYNNEYLYESGNKYLLPKHINRLSLQSQWKNLSLAVEYEHTRNDFMFNTKYSPELSVALSKPYNVPNTYAINIQGQWFHTIGIWTPTLSVMCKKPFVEFEGSKYNKFSATMMLKNRFRFTNGFDCSLNGMYFTGGSQQLSDISPFYKVDFFLNKSFLNNSLRLSLSVEDIFASYNPTARITSDGLKIKMSQNPDYRKLVVSITYFLPNKKNRFNGKNSSSEINRL